MKTSRFEMPGETTYVAIAQRPKARLPAESGRYLVLQTGSGSDIHMY
jgi:hypothetical protein